MHWQAKCWKLSHRRTVATLRAGVVCVLLPRFSVDDVKRHWEDLLKAPAIRGDLHLRCGTPTTFLLFCRDEYTTALTWRLLWQNKYDTEVQSLWPRREATYVLRCSTPTPFATILLSRVHWLMIAFITCKSSLVPLLDGLCTSNPCRFEFSVFWVFAGIEPTTSGLTVLRSDQLS